MYGDFYVNESEIKIVKLDDDGLTERDKPKSPELPVERNIRLLSKALGKSWAIVGTDPLPVPSSVSMSEDELREFKQGIDPLVKRMLQRRKDEIGNRVIKFEKPQREADSQAEAKGLSIDG